MPFLARRRDRVVLPRVLCIDARLSARRLRTTATWSSFATMWIEVDLLLFVLSMSVPPRPTSRPRGSAQDTLRRSRGDIFFKNPVSMSGPRHWRRAAPVAIRQMPNCSQQQPHNRDNSPKSWQAFSFWALSWSVVADEDFLIGNPPASSRRRRGRTCHELGKRPAMHRCFCPC